VFTALYDGQVSIKITVAHRLQKTETGVEGPFVEIVEEQPTHSPRFLAVLEVEILVTPCLKARIHFFPKRGTSLLGYLVPMAAVLFKPIIRGQVIAAPKPPHRFLTGLFRHKETYVGMGGGYIGVAG